MIIDMKLKPATLPGFFVLSDHRESAEGGREKADGATTFALF
jgi:hypothetical protein